ncbi:MAG TPA: hypothetical protein DDZ89_10335 [Clostridiales bacterium]|nr:hypothetical protein [Clostridiales bacterium]
MLKKDIRWAPSVVNYQPYRFIVATEQEVKDKISESYPCA